MKYSRILLKLSGESLAANGSHGIDDSVLTEYARQVIDVVNEGCEVAIVIGGGNIFRGLSGTESGFDRVKGDQMGMLATVINSLALESAIVRLGGKAKVFTSIRMEPVGELYNRDKVLDVMKNSTIAILSGGTGNPFFTTDTTAVLRAAELEAQAVLKATNVDGVYTADPKKDPKAKRYDKLSHQEAIEKDLRVMDGAAFALARENRMPIIVFSVAEKGAIETVLRGKGRSTVVG